MIPHPNFHVVTYEFIVVLFTIFLTFSMGVIIVSSFSLHFVGLSFYTNDKGLSEAFSQYGQVIEGDLWDISHARILRQLSLN